MFGVDLSCGLSLFRLCAAWSLTAAYFKPRAPLTCLSGKESVDLRALFGLYPIDITSRTHVKTLYQISFYLSYIYIFMIFLSSHFILLFIMYTFSVPSLLIYFWIYLLFITFIKQCAHTEYVGNSECHLICLWFKGRLWADQWFLTTLAGF